MRTFKIGLLAILSFVAVVLLSGWTTHTFAPISFGTLAARPTTCVANIEFYVQTDIATGIYYCNSTGTGWLTVANASTLSTTTDPWRDIRTFGAACIGSGDDTSSFASALAYYGQGAGQGGHNGKLLIPNTGGCVISNQLTYIGNLGSAFRIEGMVGYDRGPVSSPILWNGPKCGTMLLMLGANSTYINNVNFSQNWGGNATAACNGVWYDANNQATAAGPWSISGVTRTASGLTTYTTSINSNRTSSDIVYITGVTDSSFNGYYHVLYATANTFTVVQGGAAASSSGGTAQFYVSNPSSGNYMDRVGISGFRSPGSTISTIQGNPIATVITTAANYCTVGDRAIVVGSSDASYSAPYVVITVTDSTHLTANVDTLQTGTSGALSNGGTIYCGSSGIRFGNRNNTGQEDTFKGSDILVQGVGLGDSVSGIRWDGGGNTKDYHFDHLICAYMNFCVDGFASGQLLVNFYEGSLTPNTGLTTGGVHFLDLLGQSHLVSMEQEDNGGSRLLVVGQGANTSMADESFQSLTPVDDYLIISGAPLTIQNSFMWNNRTATSVPKISMSCAGAWDQSGTPIDRCGYISHGNTYVNVPAGSLIPFYSNGVQLQSSNNTAWNIESIGDQGCGGNGSACANANTAQLKNILTMNTLYLGDPDPVQTTYIIVPTQGNLRGPKGFTAFLRNNANNGDVQMLAMDSNDIIQLGDTHGIKTPPGFFSTLPTCAAGTEGARRSVTDSTTNTLGNTITGGGTLHVDAYCDGTNWTVAAK